MTNNVPCLEVTEEELKVEEYWYFVTRAYLNPETKTGPDYSQLIPDTILEFAPN